MKQPLRMCLFALLGIPALLRMSHAEPAAGEVRAVAPRPISCASRALKQDCRGEDFDYFVSGNPAAPRPARTRFGIILMGGGGSVDAAYRTLSEHAALGHIVVLGATADHSFDPDDGELGPLFLGPWGPTLSCQTFIFHSRTAAFDARVIAALRHADGVFLEGGDQSNYVRYWKGTPVQGALNNLAKRGAPIGGNSAGLAILGHFSYTAMDGGSLESKVALADPLGPAVTLEDDFLHLPGLENVITDTHFSTRSRLGRLIVFIARLDRGPPARQVYGIGVDQQTAVLIDADGTGHIIVGSKGSAWIVKLDGAKVILTPAQPFSAVSVRIDQMAPYSVLRMRNGLVERPASVNRVGIEAGAAVAEEPLRSMMMRDRTPPGED